MKRDFVTGSDGEAMGVTVEVARLRQRLLCLAIKSLEVNGLRRSYPFIVLQLLFHRFSIALLLLHFTFYTSSSYEALWVEYFCAGAGFLA